VVAAADANLSLQVTEKKISLSSKKWEKLEDPTGFAKNYQERGTTVARKFPRVVTVFLMPMSTDQKSGKRISDNEYVELFVVHSGLVTALTRLDKGRYWVQCRETFYAKPSLPIDVSKYKPFMSEEENTLLRLSYETEIDETRFLLGETF
jgi:hypothetical protein